MCRKIWCDEKSWKILNFRWPYFERKDWQDRVPVLPRALYSSCYARDPPGSPYLQSDEEGEAFHPVLPAREEEGNKVFWQQKKLLVWKLPYSYLVSTRFESFFPTEGLLGVRGFFLFLCFFCEIELIPVWFLRSKHAPESNVSCFFECHCMMGHLIHASISTEGVRRCLLDLGRV